MQRIFAGGSGQVRVQPLNGFAQTKRQNDLAVNPEREIELGLFKMRIPQYPIEGVREAVLNALTHRDYLNPGEILVRHSKQELVITSPGGFVAGITPENILRHEAVPRNRTLANALVKLRLVESSGVGRRRIFRSALVYGKRRPQYQTDGHAVTLRLFNRQTHDAVAQVVARLDAAGAEVSTAPQTPFP